MKTRFLPLLSNISEFVKVQSTWRSHRKYLISRSYTTLPTDQIADESISNHTIDSANIIEALDGYQEIYGHDKVLSLGIEELKDHAKQELQNTNESRKRFLYSQLGALENYNQMLLNNTWQYHSVPSAWSVAAAALSKKIPDDFIYEETDEEPLETGSATTEPLTDDYAREQQLFEEQKLYENKKGFNWMMSEVWLHAIDKIRPSKKIFISYAWPIKNEHLEGWTKPFVENLATHLTRCGLQVFLDDFHSGGGDNLRKFMRKIRRVDHVLLISTRTLGIKSKRANSGVSYEDKQIKKRMELIDKALLKRQHSEALKKKKFLIPVLLNMKNYCSDDYKCFGSINACEDSYQKTLQQLLRHIYKFGTPRFIPWWSENWKMHGLNESTPIQPLWGNRITTCAHYVRRVEEENAIARSLRKARREEKILHEFSIYGLDGVGKSELLAHLFTSPPSYYKHRAIFDASSEMNLLLDYSKFAQEICGIQLESVKNHHELALKVKPWLESTPNWLIGYKNVPTTNSDNVPWLKSYLPTSGGHIIFTSNQPITRNAINLQGMTKIECSQLVTNIYGKPLEESERLYKEYDHMPAWLTLALDEIKNSLEYTTVEKFLARNESNHFMHETNNLGKTFLNETDNSKYALLLKSQADRIQKLDLRAQFLLIALCYLDTESISNEITYDIFKEVTDKTNIHLDIDPEVMSHNEHNKFNVYYEAIEPLIKNSKVSIDTVFKLFENTVITRINSGTIAIPKIYAKHIKSIYGQPINNYLLRILNKALRKSLREFVDNKNIDFHAGQLLRHFPAVIDSVLNYDLHKTDIVGLTRLFMDTSIAYLPYNIPTSFGYANIGYSFCLLDNRFGQLLLGDYHNQKYFEHLLRSASAYLSVLEDATFDEIAVFSENKQVFNDHFETVLNLALKLIELPGYVVDPLLKASIKYACSKSLLNKRDRHGAISTILDAISVLDNINTEDAKVACFAYKQRLINLYSIINDYHSAIEVGEKLIESMRAANCNHYYDRGVNHIDIFIAYRDYGCKIMSEYHHTLALQHIQEVSLLLEQCNDNLEKTKLEMIKKAILEESKLQKNKETALKMYIELTEQPYYLPFEIHRIWQSYIKLSKEDLVSRVQDTVNILVSRIEKDFDKLSNLICHASAIIRLKKSDLALDILRKASRYKSDLSFDRLEDARLQLSLARAYHHKGEFALAHNALLDALEIYTKHIICGQTDLVNVYIKKLIDEYGNSSQSAIVTEDESLKLLDMLEEHHFMLLRPQKDYVHDPQFTGEINTLIEIGLPKQDINRLIHIVRGDKLALKFAIILLSNKNTTINEFEKQFSEKIKELTLPITVTHIDFGINPYLYAAINTVTSYIDTEQNEVTKLAYICSCLVHGRRIPIEFLANMIACSTDITTIIDLLVNYALLERVLGYPHHVVMNMAVGKALLFSSQFVAKDNSIQNIFHAYSTMLYKFTRPLSNKSDITVDFIDSFGHEIISGMSLIMSENLNNKINRFTIKSSPFTLYHSAEISYFFMDNLMLAKYYIDKLFKDFLPTLDHQNMRELDQTVAEHLPEFLCLRANIYSKINKDIAKHGYQDALIVARRFPENPEVLNDLLISLTANYDFICEYSNSDQIIELSNDLINTLSKENGMLEKHLHIKLHLSKAEYYLLHRNFEIAAKEIASARKLAESETFYWRLLPRIMNIESQLMYYENRKVNNVLSLLGMSLEAQDKVQHHDPLLKAETLGLIGKYQIGISPRKAQANLEKSLEELTAIKEIDRLMLAERYVDLSKLHLQQKDIEKAKNNYEAAINNYHESTTPEDMTAQRLKIELIKLAFLINRSGKTTVQSPAASSGYMQSKVGSQKCRYFKSDSNESDYRSDDTDARQNQPVGPRCDQ